MHMPKNESEDAMASTIKLTALRAERVSAGYSVTRLAQLATVSDWTVTQSEAGGACTEPVAVRLADALAVSLVTLGRSPLL
jgi:predicted transcriptional regulator